MDIREQFDEAYRGERTFDSVSECVDAEWEARKPAPGTLVEVREMFFQQRPIALARVIECVDGLTDFGGPENGPSTPSESIHVRVRIERDLRRLRKSGFVGSERSYDISQIEVIR